MVTGEPSISACMDRYTTHKHRDTMVAGEPSIPWIPPMSIHHDTMATGELPPLYSHPSPPREQSSPTATNPITETILSSGTTETILSSGTTETILPSGDTLIERDHSSPPAIR
ncbi:hypothetical protein P152DRAFT_485878 [Eremomyces bilateralis CBS 781.70]|uniref:Uncharacterized protein n=1 Tax=Eremomyces bilateralis CBS 781.70 TaxID=1392243 RepID=A0A6G1FQE4_9PEZI|nr:uncharacterized protein P152DRAFT_485878 [Eremomyces bilateralis CBS 781.70]KAF1807909.1 hypothetical protein P152DRAFT_485878 [Eremomyces bilateralis CBS 781.70]